MFCWFECRTYTEPPQGSVAKVAPQARPQATGHAGKYLQAVVCFCAVLVVSVKLSYLSATAGLFVGLLASFLAGLLLGLLGSFLAILLASVLLCFLRLSFLL